MTTLILDGYLVKEGNDMESKLFFYSKRPIKHDCNEFSAGNDDDNVFLIDLPIKNFTVINEPHRCKITVELEK